jgi:hypothetical protein
VVGRSAAFAAEVSAIPSAKIPIRVFISPPDRAGAARPPIESRAHQIIMSIVLI